MTQSLQLRERTAEAVPRTRAAERRPAAARRRERDLFLIGAGVIDLHVADDSFLQPQPGHVGRRLPRQRPRAARVLGLPVAAYLRLRAGGRAAIALVLGYFGIVVGIEGAYHATKVGPSGDDFTGLLALAAGVALLGLGLVTLWRTRRLDGMVRRYVRRAAIGAASLFLFVFVLFGLGYAYVGTHVARPPIDDIDLGSATVEEVQLQTSDGLKLEGSYVPSENGAAAIVAFGRKGTQPPARMLVRHGYGVLIFDRRGEGEGRRSQPIRPGTRASATSSRRSTFSRTGPTSTRVASADSGCQSAARPSCRPRRTARMSRPLSRRVPAPAR